MFELVNTASTTGVSVVAATALSHALSTYGGAATLSPMPVVTRTVWKVPAVTVEEDNDDDVPEIPKIVKPLRETPQGKSVLFMAIAMACHYLGYSLARPITLSLFTSATTGYAGSAAAYPFSMAFVSPLSLLMLMGYGRILDAFGPRGALVRSTLFCSLVMGGVGTLIKLLGETVIAGIPAGKLLTGPLFVFRESYVQLLTSQYWSYFASVLTPNQSAQWFAPIAGLTSIASALAGVMVEPIVKYTGLAGGLVGTSIFLLLSLFFAREAYLIAHLNNFTPTSIVKPQTKESEKIPDDLGKDFKKEMKRQGIITKSMQLFHRVPVLGALFVEILASQGLATILNVIFVTRLGTAIPDDTMRAGYVGKFFALINSITMILQFGVLPRLLSSYEPRDLWRVLPLITAGMTLYQALQMNPTLLIVSATLLVMKVSEYSARRLLDELVFVPLDFESRYIGKEVIGVFGYRFGKSIMSLGLSGITSVAGGQAFGLQQLSMIGTIVATFWMRIAFKLSNMVPTRAQAEAAYQLARKEVFDESKPKKTKKKKTISHPVPVPRLEKF